MNWLDRAIELVDPVRALKRRAARETMALWGGSSDSYNSTDPRRRQNRGWWQPRPTSADTATLPALVELRSQSRDATRKNPIAGGAIATMTTDVVATGLSVQPQVNYKLAGITEDAARKWGQDAKEYFELWASNPAWADYCGDLTFYGLQALAFRSALESGDCFALLPMDKYKDDPWATKVQLIEADRICNPNGTFDGGTEWRGGILLDANGRPFQAAIARKHPGGIEYGVGATKNEWDIVRFFGEQSGRRNIIQLIPKLRPGQRRGVPLLAPVLETLSQMGIAVDAELRAVVISAAFTAFVKQPQAVKGPIDPKAGPASNVNAQAIAINPATGLASNEVRLESGAILDLAPGEDIVFADPTRPNSALDVFIQALSQQIGQAVEIPYEVLVKRFTASYSAARAALLQFWRTVRVRREWTGSQFCQPVYEAVITECVTSGKLKATGFLRDPLVRAAYLRSIWIGDAQGQINPKDEATAAQIRLDSGISDKAYETIAYNGRNWEDVHAERVREKTAEDAAGMTPPAPKPAGPADQTVQPDPNQPESN